MITRMDKEDILLLTDKGLAVFKYYIPFSFKLGRNFLNPLYKDSKASCNVYFDRRNGMYKMKDFGNDDYSGDCFALVGKLNGLNCKEPKDFVQILAIIDRDMHLGLSDNFLHYICSGDCGSYTCTEKRALRLRNLPFGEKVVSRKRC